MQRDRGLSTYSMMGACQPIQSLSTYSIYNCDNAHATITDKENHLSFSRCFSMHAIFLFKMMYINIFLYKILLTLRKHIIYVNILDKFLIMNLIGDAPESHEESPQLKRGVRVR